MKLLLDTPIALWALLDSGRLPAAARTAILDPVNAIHVSAASLWEISIKHGLRRGQADDMPLSATDASAMFDRAGYAPLPVTATHTAALDGLPPHHGDPFDRMLIAQAAADGLHLVTHDSRLAVYGAMVMMV